ncbi:orotate phosphoribosyltransferase [Thermodesulfobacterium hydrogeniphilum]|uniref:orotate phosphoribosyltransferase n=1 Tax=Thermodesulfobacterium hydrogeniphilum TaxID=161156 RepID=UPI00068FD16D|nr:orotate phosphoribosyltransferase [Thermodesulfobacterium hydrogeniphilum]
MPTRKFTRIPISAIVEFIWKEKSYKGEIKDISYGGVFIESSIIPEINTEIPIIFFLEGIVPSIKIFLKGKVVRIEPEKGFGLKFTYISTESFKHLKNLIFYNMSDEIEAEKELHRFLGEAYPLIKSLKLLNISAIKSELIDYIIKRAFLYSPDKPFILSSGKESPYYLDCRKVTLYSKTFDLIGSLFWEEIKYLKVDAVAGMSIGADPIVCGILAKAAEEEHPLEGFLIRKEPKKYGTHRQIEGNVKKGMITVIVEDVVTTGKSVIKAIEAAEKEGLKIMKILALIDREEGGKENIKSKGYEFQAFFTLKEIIERYKQIHKN